MDGFQEADFVSNARTGFLCLFILIAAQWVAVRVNAELSVGGPMLPKDPLYQLIGSAKEVVGDTMFLKAESYFHGGAQRDFTWEDEEDREKEGNIEEKHAHEHPAAYDWPALVNERVKSHEHYHLKQAEQKEILPFLFLATQLDPYNEEAQLSTAYWLEKRLGKPEDAAQVLDRARLANPNSWEIAFELGNLYMRFKKYDKAIFLYEETLIKPDFQSASILNRAHLYYFMAQSYEYLGNKDKARENYEQFLNLLPSGQALPLRRQVTQKLESLI